VKVVLDVDKLLADGRITSEECARLKQFALEDTGSLAFNILVGFGVIATAGGALALVPSTGTALLLGVVLSAAGISLTRTQGKKWGLLGSILLLVGSITAAGGIVVLTEGNAVGYLIVTAVCLAVSVLAQSSLMAVLSALSLSASIGAMTAYGSASYVLVVRQPTLTVFLFSVLSLFAYRLSERLPADHARIAVAFSRTSLFLVNLGFWVGSLWGDSFWLESGDWSFRSGAVIPDWAFVIGWAIGLVATGVWAARQDKRWVVNLLAVFGAIHFYTQYFERLGASPGSILTAGLVAIGIAVALVRYNRPMTAQSS
jgi:hypothetical protein